MFVGSAVFIGQYHDPGYPTKAAPQPVQVRGTGNSWGPGVVLPHGTMQRFNRLPKAWPIGSSSIIVHGEGANSPWLGYVKSSGYWQIMYRWLGKTPPPKARYTVIIRTVAIVQCSGDFVTASGRAGPPDFVDTHVPTTNRGGFFDEKGQRATSNIQHDSAGYYLIITSDPISGEVRQSKQFQQWGGDISAEIEFSQPR